MNKLYNWSAKRSGSKMTIMHSVGHVANIDRIFARGNRVFAVRDPKGAVDGETFELVLG